MWFSPVSCAPYCARCGLSRSAISLAARSVTYADALHVLVRMVEIFAGVITVYGALFAGKLHVGLHKA